MNRKLAERIQQLFRDIENSQFETRKERVSQLLAFLDGYSKAIVEKRGNKKWKKQQ